MTDREPTTDETPLPPPAVEVDTTAEKSGRQQQVTAALTLVAAAALTALLWPAGDSSATKPGGFLVDDGGRPVPLGQRLAPVTLLHFWATWCPPCLDEIPALERLAEDFHDELDFGVTLVAVDDDQRQVEDFMGSAAAKVLYDPSWEVARRYGTTKLPETYMLVDGEVVERFVGATNWDSPQVREQLQAAIEKRSAGS